MWAKIKNVVIKAIVGRFVTGVGATQLEGLLRISTMLYARAILTVTSAGHVLALELYFNSKCLLETAKRDVRAQLIVFIKTSSYQFNIIVITQSMYGKAPKFHTIKSIHSKFSVFNCPT